MYRSTILVAARLKIAQFNMLLYKNIGNNILFVPRSVLQSSSVQCQELENVNHIIQRSRTWPDCVDSQHRHHVRRPNGRKATGEGSR